MLLDYTPPLIVDANPDDAACKIRIDRDLADEIVDLAKINIEIFELGAAVAGERILSASSGSPADGYSRERFVQSAAKLARYLAISSHIKTFDIVADC